MEGLRRLNGAGDSRLIFRFKGESSRAFNNVIYNRRVNRRDSGSTNFESGSNERQSNYLSSNTSESETDASEEVIRQDFTNNILRMALLLCCIASHYELLNIMQAHQRELQELSVLVGVLLGPMFYLLLGFKKSLIFSNVVVAGSILGLMYIEDRNREFHSTSAELIQQEQSQFHLGMKIMNSVARSATLMALTQHQIASYGHKDIFDALTRIPAIGFCLFFATISS